MKARTVQFLFVVFLLGAAWTNAATRDEALTLLDAASAEVKAKGMVAAADSFNFGGKWSKDDMYVVMVQFDGMTLAHSTYGKMPGKNMLEAKDATGKYFLKEAIALARANGHGEIQMRWPHPQNKRITDAAFFVQRVDGRDALVGTVIFK